MFCLFLQVTAQKDYNQLSYISSSRKLIQSFKTHYWRGNSSGDSMDDIQ